MWRRGSWQEVGSGATRSEQVGTAVQIDLVVWSGSTGVRRYVPQALSVAAEGPDPAVPSGDSFSGTAFLATGLGKHARSLSQSTGNTSEALSDRASTRNTSTAPCCSVAIWTSMPIARAPARYGGCQSIPTLDARSSP